MRRKLLFAGMFALSSMLLVAVLAGTDTNQYTEDFTSTLYCDALNTTAWWDTVSGELKLPPFDLTLAGSCDTPSEPQHIALAGDYAYVADYLSGLQVIDISDPTSPTIAGSYDTQDYATFTALAGDYAYVTDWTSGLQVIDISDPTSPTLAGSYDTPGSAIGVALAGDYAYVADDLSGLQVIDISDPTSPSLAGSYDTPSHAYSVTIAGDYAYVADGSSGLQVLDISDPTNPTIAGSCDTPGLAVSVTLAGDYAYVTDYSSGLQVIDITDPTNPTIAGSCDTPGFAFFTALAGDYAYVANHTQGLFVIDISDPTSPSILGSYDTPGHAHAVAITGDYAFVGDQYGDNSVQVIDIADPTSLSLEGSYDYIADIWDVAVSGNYAYAAGYIHGLRVLDISDPTSPSLAGSYDTPGYAYHTALAGDFAYVADRAGGLQVIDISDPTSPALAGSYPATLETGGVAVCGDYAFVSDGSAVKVLDISDPTNPSLAGSYNTPGTTGEISISGDYAYIVVMGAGPYVLDISDPTNPSLAGSYSSGSIYNLALCGDYAYVADGSDGLLVIDISDPTSPTPAGSYNTPGTALDVAISGDYAYVTDYTSGIHMLDISDPTNPSLVSSYDTPGYADGIAIHGDYAYVADRNHGLQVMQIYQRAINPSKNRGQSVSIDEMDNAVGWVKLTTTHTDSIRWELSADDGTNWQEVLPNGVWNVVTTPGSDLIWRSTHVYFSTQPTVNPTCTSLEINWLYECGVINSITDVPNDQGKQVSIIWTRSGHDYAGSPTPITEYAIYRRIDYNLSSALTSEIPEQDKLEYSHSGGDHSPKLAYPPGDWHFLMTVPAYCEESYAVVVPTLADSTISKGMYHTTFFIRAGTGTAGVYFDSPPDSGYSVDNLAPHVPTGFAIAYNTGSGTELAWEECLDNDFQYFRIYRSESEDFEPDPGTIVHMTTDTNWLDTVAEGWRYHYKITAVDFSGNESNAASAGTVTGDDMPTAPAAFALHQNVPNPFNPTTMIRFDLPARSYVRLAVYNVKGQLVRVLLDGEIDAGCREIRWNGRDSMGRSVASGIYFYRLDTTAFSESRKMILLR